MIWFINNLQIVTAINYYTIADLRNLQSLHTNLLSLFLLFFTIRFLATDLYHGNYKSLTKLRIPNIDVLQQV
jgi:hypothetical protein